MNFNTPIILLILFMLIATGCKQKDIGTPSPKTPPPVQNNPTPSNLTTLNINTNSKTNLNKNLYGFNTSLNKVPFSGGFADLHFNSEMKVLSPTIERFPGGTKSNFYHWNPDALKGGTSYYKSEIDLIDNVKLRSQIQSSYTALVNKRSGILSFQNFMQHCRQNNITPIIVINAHTGTAQEAAAWVQYVKDNNFKVLGWEIGNELYMSRFWPINIRKDTNAMANSYLSLVQTFAGAMKAVDPTIKIGVTAAPRDIYAQKPEHDLWNTILGNVSNTSYDFYITHIYTGAPAVLKTISNMRDYLFGNNDTDLETTMQYFQNYFQKRPMWITEWNFYGFSKALDGSKNIVTLTQLGSMFAFDFLITLFNKNLVELATYHVLGGSGRWPSPISESTDPSDIGILRNSVFYPLYLVGQAFNSANTRYTITTLKDKNGLSLPNQIGTLNFAVPPNTYDYNYKPVNYAVLSGASNYYIMSVNRTSNPYNISIKIDNKNYTRQVSSKCISRNIDYQGDNVMVTTLNPVDLHLKSASQPGNNILFPENSFCLFTFSK